MHRHALSSMSAKVVSAPMAAASSRWTMMSGYLQRAVCKVHPLTVLAVDDSLFAVPQFAAQSIKLRATSTASHHDALRAIADSLDSVSALALDYLAVE